MASASSTSARPERPRGEGLGRRQRLISSRLFDEAYAQNRKFVGRHMVMFLRTGDDAALRLGVVTGRKIGCAALRTRSRRLLREAFRRQRAAFSGAYDVVLLARAGLAAADFQAVMADLSALARKARLVES